MNGEILKKVSAITNENLNETFQKIFEKIYYECLDKKIEDVVSVVDEEQYIKTFYKKKCMIL